MPLPASRPLSTLALALIPRAVALNLALGAVVGALKLPVYLDSVGTILVAALAGPWAGIVTGIVSNSVLGMLVSPALFAFIPVAIVIGWLAGVAGRLGAFGSLVGSVAAGLVIGIAAALISAVIVIALMGGLTASGTGILTIAIRAMFGVSVDSAAKIAAVVTDALDKPLSCVLVYLVLERLPRRLRARFRGAIA
ncbi:MAG: ECF transporter S component [Gemmatimonadota bacterium]|nr:ECF transporter S component [Gemmatimonadota bacterium]